MDFEQDTEKCTPEGRDCIKEHSSESFNCSTTCEGVYADVQCTKEGIKEEREQPQIAKLIDQYEKYKRQKIQHFVFNASAISTNFGNLLMRILV